MGSRDDRANNSALEKSDEGGGNLAGYAKLGLMVLGGLFLLRIVFKILAFWPIALAVAGIAVFGFYMMSRSSDESGESSGKRKKLGADVDRARAEVRGRSPSASTSSELDDFDRRMRELDDLEKKIEEEYRA